MERVILRCLEEDPASRPATALAVAAALPGGDPLAAALAAGETPSPQMVAASGETAGLRPRVAVICLGAMLLGLAFTIYSVHYSALGQNGAGTDSRSSHSEVARDIARLGYGGRPADSAYGLDFDSDFQDYVEKNDKPPPHWDAVLAARPSLLQYWYRQSPDDDGGQRLPGQSADTGDRHSE